MLEKLKDVLVFMGLIGIPSLTALSVRCFVLVKTFTTKVNILMKAQQAQMRAQLLDNYHRYMDAGYISEDDLAEWENQYQSYHELGKNGVLDFRRSQLMQLPNVRQQEV